MAIANGTCVSFCNQPKAQFGYVRRVTPLCRCLHPFCGWRHLATSRESKAHFAFPGYPWDCGKCYMDGKRIQCWSNASQHVPINLQPFTSYSEILVGNCNFFLPLAFNAPAGCWSGVRGNINKLLLTVVMCCILLLHILWSGLQVSQIGFCLTGSISL